MDDAERVSDLLIHWEEAIEAERTVTFEELCRDCPELLPEGRTPDCLLLLSGLLERYPLVWWSQTVFAEPIFGASSRSWIGLTRRSWR